MAKHWTTSLLLMKKLGVLNFEVSRMKLFYFQGVRLCTFLRGKNRGQLWLCKMKKLELQKIKKGKKTLLPECLSLFMTFHHKGLFLPKMISRTYIRVQFNNVMLWTWADVPLAISVISHCVKCAQIRSYFWFVFACIWTEYGDLLRKSLYSVRIQENTDEK